MFLLSATIDERLHGQHGRRRDLAGAGAEDLRAARGRARPIRWSRRTRSASPGPPTSAASPRRSATAPTRRPSRLIAVGHRRDLTFLQWTIIGSTLTRALPRHCPARLPASPCRSVPTRSRVRRRPRSSPSERRQLGPMPPAERWAIGWFLLAILLWFVPDICALSSRSAETAELLQRSLHMSVPALLIPIAMCLVPVRDPNRRYRADVAGMDEGRRLGARHLHRRRHGARHGGRRRSDRPSRLRPHGAAAVARRPVGADVRAADVRRRHPGHQPDLQHGHARHLHAARPDARRRV